MKSVVGNIILHRDTSASARVRLEVLSLIAPFVKDCEERVDHVFDSLAPGYGANPILASYVADRVLSDYEGRKRHNYGINQPILKSDTIDEVCRPCTPVHCFRTEVADGRSFLDSFPPVFTDYIDPVVVVDSCSIRKCSPRSTSLLSSTDYYRHQDYVPAFGTCTFLSVHPAPSNLSSIELTANVAGKSFRKLVSFEKYLIHDGRRCYFETGTTRQERCIPLSNSSRVILLTGEYSGTAVPCSTKSVKFVGDHGRRICGDLLDSFLTYRENGPVLHVRFLPTDTSFEFPRCRTLEDHHRLRLRAMKILNQITSAPYAVVPILCICEYRPIYASLLALCQPIVCYVDKEGSRSSSLWGQAVLMFSGPLSTLWVWTSTSVTIPPPHRLFAKGKALEQSLLPDRIVTEFDTVLPWTPEYDKFHTPLGGVIQMAVRTFAIRLGIPHLDFHYSGRDITEWQRRSRAPTYHARFSLAVKGSHVYVSCIGQSESDFDSWSAISSNLQYGSVDGKILCV